MHLAIVTESYPPEVNGAAPTVQSRVARLRDHGHAVTVVRPLQADGHDPDSEFEMLVASLALPRSSGRRFGCVSRATDPAIAGPGREAARVGMARLDPTQVMRNFAVLVGEIVAASNFTVLSHARGVTGRAS